MGGLYDTINGAVTDLTGLLVSTYGAVQGAQLQKAQIDLATARVQAEQRATLAPVNSSGASGTTGGAKTKINWTMIGLAVTAVFGVALLVRAK